MAQPEPQPQSGPAPEPGAQPAAPIDLKLLAERVYQLMLADLRLDRARGGQPARRKGR